MRRHAGVGAIKKNEAIKERFQSKSTALAESEASKLSQQIEMFRSHLQTFANKHGDKIRNNGEFRKQFQVMCATIGVDPLASHRGFWSELLGVGDFYYHLSVKMVEVCKAQEARTGGLMDVYELRRILNQRRTVHETEITVDDIVRAVGTMEVFGPGFRLIRMESGKGASTKAPRLMIQSVPSELSLDQTAMLKLASDSEKAYITIAQCRSQMGWEQERVERALTQLLQLGIAWIDHNGPQGEDTYWFPGIFQTLSSSAH